jgi:hypothetical protein
MKNKFNRRDFLLKGSKIGIAACAFLSCQKLGALNGLSFQDDKSPDPAKLNYCGYTCPADCKMLKATLENNVELKKEAYVNWKIQEKYGLAFDPEQIFCYGCKTEEKPSGIVIKNCTVRSCAISKGFDCCIECNDLASCDKELWTTFPDFKKAVIEMQKKYFNAKKENV